MSAKVLIAGACALALAACATGARKPDVALPAAYEAPAGSTQLSDETLDRWWTIFGDDELNGLEDQALKLSPDAKTQIARLQEAAATRNSTILQTYPTGDLTGSATRQTAYAIGGPSNSIFPVGGVTDTDQLNFNVSWELDFLGGLKDERRIARYDFAATQFDAEAAWASLVANVADSYFVARGLAIQLDDADEQLKIEQQLLSVAQAKSDHGIGAQSDADRIAGDFAQSQSQVSSLKAQEHAAQRLLLILVGRGREPVEQLPLAATVPDPPPLPEAVPGDLLTRRPDVREADMRVREAALQTKLAKEQLFPNLTLKPALGIVRTASPGIGVVLNAANQLVGFVPEQQTTASDFWSYGVGLNQPVLDIPRLLQDAKAQGARTEQAVIAYEQAVQNAYGDAENALVELSSDEERIKTLESGEASARRAYDAAVIRYKAGLDDITSVLTVEQEWRTDRSALTGERVQALRRAVQTYKALGGGWDYQPTQTAARSP
ncbi:MAG TPA: efflux transporter outer membrane subunit [Caulobacteraceae bacterium]|nr:efflux transporter outer membrane subunit [Caulobacteraceae bacterium]